MTQQATQAALFPLPGSSTRQEETPTNTPRPAARPARTAQSVTLAHCQGYIYAIGQTAQQIASELGQSVTPVLSGRLDAILLEEEEIGQLEQVLSVVIVESSPYKSRHILRGLGAWLEGWS